MDPAMMDRYLTDGMSPREELNDYDGDRRGWIVCCPLKIQTQQRTANTAYNTIREALAEKKLMQKHSEDFPNIKTNGIFICPE